MATTSNKKRSNDLDSSWFGNELKDMVTLNACVVWNQETQGYFVFTTTDMSKSAKEIIMMYQMRPKIEEDFLNYLVMYSGEYFFP